MNNIVSWVFHNLASQTLYQTAPLKGYGDIQYIDLQIAERPFIHILLVQPRYTLVRVTIVASRK